MHPETFNNEDPTLNYEYTTSTSPKDKKEMTSGVIEGSYELK